MAQKVLVFDVDGVIADSTPSIYRGVSAVCRFNGVEPPLLEFLCDHFWSPWEASYARMGVKLSYDEIWRVYDEGLGVYDPEVFPSLPPVLKKLADLGVPTAVLSANKSERVENLLQKFGIHHLFAKVRCVTNSKILALRDLVKEFGVTPDNLFYLGDMVSDMEDAKVAGVRPIGFCSGYGTPEVLYRAGAEEVIFSHVEIFSLLNSKRR